MSNYEKYLGNSMMSLARRTAGVRETYAIEHGNCSVRYIAGHKFLVFTYSKSVPYQDANGAMFDCTEGRWRG